MKELERNARRLVLMTAVTILLTMMLLNSKRDDGDGEFGGTLTTWNTFVQEMLAKGEACSH